GLVAPPPAQAGAAASAGAAPAASGSPSLVFSEVYAPIGSDPAHQWFELYNRQANIDYPLNGLILATGRNQVILSTSVVITHSDYVLFVFAPDAIAKGLVEPSQDVLVKGKTAQVVAVPDLGGLDPQADALILYPPVPGPDKSLIIDQVNWGTPNPNWANYNAALWQPGLAPLAVSADGRPRSWGRTPADQDTDQGHTVGGDWTLHEILSPGGKVTGSKPSDFLLLWTNVAGGLSSLLLWAAFVIIAIIAYRFERLRDTRTYWQLLLLAPSGILFYTIIVIIGFNQPGAALTNEQKWLSFPVLAVSAVFCLIAVGIFRNVARSLLEGD
ncbi:MAG: hypothetical protein M3Z04_11715, partial [Chloroflexota bacterium]|nr:hypothetical protein [Chloroflexota bacterium]